MMMKRHPLRHTVQSDYPQSCIFCTYNRTLTYTVPDHLRHNKLHPAGLPPAVFFVSSVDATGERDDESSPDHPGGSITT